MTKGIGQAPALKWAEYDLDLEQRTHIMGVLNVTPDSFSDGGLYFQREKAIEQGLVMAGEGADIIDVGGESTRPYAEKVSVEEEIERVIPIIEALRKEINIPICIDTFKAEVARQALRAGASLINDISALRFDPEMIPVAAEASVPVVLMHMKGMPSNMQDKPSYDHLIPEIKNFLKNAINKALDGGIKKELILLDPGIGFGKSFDHNLVIIKELKQFSSLNRPIVLGSSRKAFIGHILDNQAHERDTGTMATITAGVMNGAHIIRVHNVKKALETVKVIDAVMRGRTL